MGAFTHEVLISDLLIKSPHRVERAEFWEAYA